MATPIIWRVERQRIGRTHSKPASATQSATSETEVNRWSREWTPAWKLIERPLQGSSFSQSPTKVLGRSAPAWGWVTVTRSSANIGAEDVSPGPTGLYNQRPSQSEPTTQARKDQVDSNVQRFHPQIPPSSHGSRAPLGPARGTRRS